MKTKQERHEAICRIIHQEEISNQEELLNRLTKEGFNITQATLSRDIRSLKIVKAHGTNGNYAYKRPRAVVPTIDNTPKAIHSDSLPSIEFSGHLAVIKTKPGYAMGIASDIDSQSPKEILGTIAGDDTILIIPREGYSRDSVVKALSRFIH